jgi:hypothetical protein
MSARHNQSGRYAAPAVSPCHVQRTARLWRVMLQAQLNSTRTHRSWVEFRPTAVLSRTTTVGVRQSHGSPCRVPHGIQTRSAAPRWQGQRRREWVLKAIDFLVTEEHLLPAQDGRKLVPKGNVPFENGLNRQPNRTFRAIGTVVPHPLG